MSIHLFTVEFHDSSHGALWSIFSILVGIITIADEGKGSLVISDDLDAKDVTILAKDALELII